MAIEGGNDTLDGGAGTNTLDGAAGIEEPVDEAGDFTAYVLAYSAIDAVQGDEIEASHIGCAKIFETVANEFDIGYMCRVDIDADELALRQCDSDGVGG